MRHLLALLGSFAVHGAVLAAALFAVAQVKEKPQPVVVQAVTFDLGMMAAAKTEQPQNQPSQAQTAVAKPEPIVEEKPVVVPKKVVKPKKKKPKKIIEKKPKKKVKKKPVKKVVKKQPKKKTKTKPKKTQQPLAKKTAKKPTAKPLPIAPTATTGIGTTTSHTVKSQGKQRGGKGGKNTANNGTANAAAYKKALEVAIARIANRNALRMRKKQRIVRVRFNLGRDGRISNVTVVGKSGNRALDRAAAKALKRLGKYKPPPPELVGAIIVPIRFRRPRY